VYALNARKVKQTKLFDVFKAGPSSNSYFIFVCKILHIWTLYVAFSVKGMMHYPNLISE
jgi:hypothetical protein